MGALYVSVANVQCQVATTVLGVHFSGIKGVSMGSIGIEKLLLIGFALMILFGPSKLPELGKALGKGIQELKKASREFSDAIKDGGAEADKKE